MLDINGLGAGYGDVKIIEDLTARFEPGSFTGLIGPNGTGKSTFLKAIAGLLPHQGSVELEGEEISTGERHNQIAYMQQDTAALSSLSVMEVVLLGRVRQLGLSISNKLVDGAQEILHRFGLDHLAERRLSELSGGQRQLVFLAQTLFRDPKVLLLDEPTAALDLKHQLVVLQTVRDLVEQTGLIVIAAMHDLNLSARFSDRILCLQNGKTVGDGTPRDILHTSLIEDVYGVDAWTMRDPNGLPVIVPLKARA